MGVSLRSGSFPTLAETVSWFPAQDLTYYGKERHFLWDLKICKCMSELEVVKCVWGKRDKEAETAACA